jgi:hypothetical protein
MLALATILHCALPNRDCPSVGPQLSAKALNCKEEARGNFRKPLLSVLTIP